MTQSNKNGAAVDEVKFGEGENPERGRWPFDQLAKGKFFEVADLTKHVALRTAASRARKRLKKVFAVRKVKLEDDTVVIRVYRNK